MMDHGEPGVVDIVIPIKVRFMPDMRKDGRKPNTVQGGKVVGSAPDHEPWFGPVVISNTRIEGTEANFSGTFTQNRPVSSSGNRSTFPLNDPASTSGLRILITPWMGSYLQEPSLPVLQDLSFENLLNDPDYSCVWNNNTGSVCSLQEPHRFFLQSPRDGDQFCSFAASGKHDKNNGTIHTSLLYCAVPEIADECARWKELPASWKESNLPMIIVPIIILRHHIRFSSKALESLTNRVQKIEQNVAAAAVEQIDFNRIIRDLHLCNTDLIKLERRWRFETHLASAIREFLTTYKQPPNRRQEISFSQCRIEGTSFTINTGSEEDTGMNNKFALQNDTFFKKLDSDSMLQNRLSDASEYDLSVLPRRIQNQFTAVFNLIAQRDTKATIDLATNSHKIAEATLQDSSSMKTIAAMTLIFLPATFISSFFSMTFFDWHAAPGEGIVESIWVYFAVAIPLTIVVILCWILWTRKSRQKVGNWV
ncbi:hypothetical protein B7494_g2752 [Chlorociboria aeruginascens]|nr:hypothetical protein B7494_g2752 [Chlorociboria aeruginascens]